MIFFRILIIISYNVFFLLPNNGSVLVIISWALFVRSVMAKKKNECWLSMRDYFRNRSKNWKNVWNQRLYLRSIGCWNSFLFFSRNSVCQKFNPHFIHLYHLPFLFFSISVILRSYFYLIFSVLYVIIYFSYILNLVF